MITVFSYCASNTLKMLSASPFSTLIVIFADAVEVADSWPASAALSPALPSTLLARLGFTDDRKAGGIAGVVTSVEEAISLVESAQQWRGEVCTTCGGTCIRRYDRVQGAKWGCVGCRNAKFRINARKNRAVREAAPRRGDSSIALRKVPA